MRVGWEACMCGVKVGWTGEDVFDEWGRGTLGFVL